MCQNIHWGRNQVHEEDCAKRPIIALLTVVKFEINLNVQQEGIK